MTDPEMLRKHADWHDAVGMTRQADELRRIADKLEALENGEVQWKNTVIKLQYMIRDLREEVQKPEEERT